MELNDKLKREEISFHLTDYKSQLKDYLNLFDLFVSNENLLRFNVVAFKRGRFSNHMLKGKLMIWYIQKYQSDQSMDH